MLDLLLDWTKIVLDPWKQCWLAIVFNRSLGLVLAPLSLDMISIRTIHIVLASFTQTLLALILYEPSGLVTKLPIPNGMDIYQV